MTEFTFTIKRMFPGTDAQKNVGIYATFGLTMNDTEGIIVSFEDLKLMRSREGQYYIESPFRTYDGKDKQGNAKKQKIHAVKFFPEQKNWPKQDAIIKLVLGELEKVGSSKPEKAPQPAQAPKQAKPNTNSAPW